MATYVSKLKWAWQAYCLSHTLLILNIYITLRDVQTMSKEFFDISTGFRFSKLQFGSVPSLPVAVLGLISPNLKTKNGKTLMRSQRAFRVLTWRPCKKLTAISSSNYSLTKKFFGRSTFDCKYGLEYCKILILKVIFQCQKSSKSFSPLLFCSGILD